MTGRHPWPPPPKGHNEWMAEVGKSQYGWPESLRFTYDKTRELLRDGIPGDLVECGVGAGCHPAVMAKACMDAGETRTVRLFDSFEGVPNGSEKDGEWNSHYGDGSGRLEGTGVAACSEESVRANLVRWFGEDVPWSFKFHSGWFQRSLPDYASYLPGPIAFLRLDGDLYESTKVCLEHLWPLLSSGGICVLDDTNLDGCRDAASVYFAATEWVNLPWHSITASGDAWTVKP